MITKDFMSRMIELIDLSLDELRCIFADVPYLVCGEPSSKSIKIARSDSRGWTRGAMVMTTLKAEYPSLFLKYIPTEKKDGKRI